MYKTSQFSKAILSFDEAINLSDQPNPLFYYRRALCFHISDELGKGLEDYNKTIVLDPGNTEAYYNRAIIKKELNDSEGACNDYRSAIQLGLNISNKTLCEN
ncbi:MAG: tetratricopeptide (TPR) repeat protein [Saprospiraceae bacterium]